MPGNHDIYIIKTKGVGGEFRVRPAVTMVNGKKPKLKIRNLTDYTARLTFDPGFIDQKFHLTDIVYVASGTSAEPFLVDDRNGYFEYLVEINTDGAGTWVEAKGESAPSVIVDP
jgi:hypothetical protein